MKKAWTLLGAMLLVLVLLAGCGGGESAAPASSGSSETGGSGAAPAPAEQPQQEASKYPSKDVEFIVPFGPGGGYDTWARTLAPFIEKHLPGDHKVLVRNMEGAGGITGAQYLYKAGPEDHIIEIFNVGGMVGTELAGNLPFSLTEFNWLAQLSVDPQVAATSPATGFNSFEDMKNAGRDIVVALEGIAVNSTMASLLVFEEYGIKWKMLMHDGKGESVLSMARGDADFSMSSIDSVKQYNNDINGIVVFQDEPHPDFPNAKLAKDVGLGHLSDVVSTRRMIGASPNMDPELKTVLADAIGKAAEDPEFLQKLKEIEYDLQYLNAEDAGKMIETTIGAYSEYQDIIKKFMEENS